MPMSRYERFCEVSTPFCAVADAEPAKVMSPWGPEVEREVLHRAHDEKRVGREKPRGLGRFSAGRKRGADPPESEAASEPETERVVQHERVADFRLQREDGDVGVVHRDGRHVVALAGRRPAARLITEGQSDRQIRNDEIVRAKLRAVRRSHPRAVEKTDPRGRRDVVAGRLAD